MLNGCIQLKPKLTLLGKKKILRDFFSCSLQFSLAVIATSVLWTDQEQEGVKKSCVCAFLLSSAL